jgi:hypothetical protein
MTITMDNDDPAAVPPAAADDASDWPTREAWLDMLLEAGLAAERDGGEGDGCDTVIDLSEAYVLAIDRATDAVYPLT